MLKYKLMSDISDIKLYTIYSSIYVIVYTIYSGYIFYI